MMVRVPGVELLRLLTTHTRTYAAVARLAEIIRPDVSQEVLEQLTEIWAATSEGEAVLRAVIEEHWPEEQTH